MMEKDEEGTASHIRAVRREVITSGGHHAEVDYPQAQRHSAHHPVLGRAAEDRLAILPETLKGAAAKTAVTRLLLGLGRAAP